MKTFKFKTNTLCACDPRVRIGDRVLIQSESGQDLEDFIVVPDMGGTRVCIDRCAMPHVYRCIFYKESDDRHPCILSGCNGLFVRTPNLEEL